MKYSSSGILAQVLFLSPRCCVQAFAVCSRPCCFAWSHALRGRAVSSLGAASAISADEERSENAAAAIAAAADGVGSATIADLIFVEGSQSARPNIASRREQCSTAAVAANATTATATATATTTTIAVVGYNFARQCECECCKCECEQRSRRCEQCWNTGAAGCAAVREQEGAVQAHATASRAAKSDTLKRFSAC